jgi:hypothetical protein
MRNTRITAIQTMWCAYRNKIGGGIPLKITKSEICFPKMDNKGDLLHIAKSLFIVCLWFVSNERCLSELKAYSEHYKLQQFDCFNRESNTIALVNIYTQFSHPHHHSQHSVWTDTLSWQREKVGKN